MNKSKKFLSRVLTALLTVCMGAALLSGCGSTNSGGTSWKDSVGDLGLTFTYNGTTVAMNEEAATVLEGLGEYQSYTESASCVFDEGLDKTYDYGDFYLTTYPYNGEDYVYTLWFTTENVETEEGLKIGDSQEKVNEIYGEEYFNNVNLYTISFDNMSLQIIVADGTVTSITYNATLNQ